MTKSKISVSTSQAIIGAIIGWNIYSNKQTNIELLSKIIGTWIFCPVLAGLLAVTLYFLLRFIIKHGHFSLLQQDFYTRIGLILTGAFGAYALGANNIANIMGVFVSSNPLQPLSFTANLKLNPEQILFLLGGISIAIGIITYSEHTIQTVGRNIFLMSPLAAWVVVIAQSLVLFLFSSNALSDFMEKHNLLSIPPVPVSSSQAVIGAVIGIGLLKGGHGINWGLIGKIFIGWIITPLIAALLCFTSLFFLENVFNLIVYN